MPATIGDNSKMLTPAEERALFFHHYSPIAAAQAKVEEAKAEAKRLRKLAKADGIILRDIDFAMRCAQIDDDTIIVQDLSRQIKIARWFALPVGEQADLDFDREPLVDRAEREGLAAGLAARPRTPPYGIESEAGQVWLSSYDRGQAEVRENFQSALEKRNAERKAAKPNGHDDDEGSASMDEDDEP